MPKGLISGTFNERIHANETLLVMLQVWQGTPGINPQIFLPRHGNEATFFVFFSNFQTLDYRISKNVQANPCGFIRDNKEGPLNNCKVSLKYVKPNDRGNDLKIASFFSFLQNVAFSKFEAHFVQGIMGKI